MYYDSKFFKKVGGEVWRVKRGEEVNMRVSLNIWWEIFVRGF